MRYHFFLKDITFLYERQKDKSEKIVKVTEAALLSLVAAKLKGKVLFPQKIEDVKNYLRNVKATSV